MTVSFFTEPEKAIKQYNDKGYFIEESLFSAEQCEQMKFQGHKLSNAKNRQYSPVMMPHRENEYFLKAMKTSSLVNIISKLLNGDVSGLQSQFFFMKPGTRGFTAHQDNYFVQAKNDAFCSAWLALDDTSSDNGGLIVYPGSHAQGLLPVEETHISSKSEQDPNAYRMRVVIPEKYTSLDVKVSKGSVLFIHGCLIHSSHDNKSDNLWRHVLLNTYIRKGEAFREGRDAKRVEIVLDMSN